MTVGRVGLDRQNCLGVKTGFLDAPNELSHGR